MVVFMVIDDSKIIELWTHQANRTISYLDLICIKGKCWCTK